MNIVYVTGESYLDHSYTVVKELAEHVQLKVYFIAKSRTPEVNKWLEKFSAEFVPRIRFRNPLAFFRELGFILRLRNEKADCIWFNTLNVYQAYMVKLLLKKYIVMVHDVELHPDSADKHGVLSVKLTLRHHNKHIGVASKTQSEIFEKRFGFKPMLFQLPIIDYYKDTGTHVPPKQHSEKIRFLFFGSVEKYKGLETLLEAVEILEKKGLQFELNISGRLRYDEDKFVERIKELKSVNLLNKFIDYRDIHGIYSAADIVVLPYKQVTQCGPLLIGFSENIPAIASDLPGFSEYAEDGSSAFFFNNTAGGLAEKMEQVIKDPGITGRMSEYIRNTTQNKFGMRVLAEEYIRNFRECKQSI